MCPSLPIPAALTGRLARDERVKGQGPGELLLLVDAIKRGLRASPPGRV